MPWLLHALLVAVSLFSFAVTSFVLADGSLRKAIRLAAVQKLARFRQIDVAIVGDSLALQPRWRLTRRPLGVVNLAKGGATIKEIAGQIVQASALFPKWLVIDGGLNDLLFDDAPLAQIICDFEALLRRVPSSARAVVTLLPYVSDKAFAPRIEEANNALAALARARGLDVLDLNLEISETGARKPEMTNDGLHFSKLAAGIWADAVRRRIGGCCKIG